MSADMFGFPDPDEKPEPSAADDFNLFGEADAASAPEMPIDPADEEEGLPPPHKNTNFIGHDDAEQAIIRRYNAERMSHALIISGPEGVGKATFAHRIARFFLYESDRNADSQSALFGGTDDGDTIDSLSIPATSPVARKTASRSHPDIRVIERVFDEAKGRYKNDIPVETIRGIAPFLRMTASVDGGWRIVIVDGAEGMNNHGQNALLKILEEPPEKSLLILVTHNAGALLPTIRSRCQKITLDVMDDDTVIDLLGQADPSLTALDKQILARLASGSIGQAVQMLNNGGVQVFRQFVDILHTVSSGSADPVQLFPVVEGFSAPGSDAAYDAFRALMIRWIERLITGWADGKSAGDIAILPEDRLALEQVMELSTLSVWIDILDRLNDLFGRAARGSLEKRFTVMESLNILATGFQKPH